MISVVIPVLNGYDITNMLLQDILENTFHPAEIILIDNGSAENIFSLVHKFNSLNIVYIRNPENIGVNASWNLGRQLAKYKYITIMNNDIRINKEFFSILIDIMNSDELIGLSSPVISKDLKQVLEEDFPYDLDTEYSYTICGNAFTLSKSISDIIGPIPKELFTFYGDDFILSKIKQMGYRSVIMNNNEIFHYDHRTLCHWKNEQGILEEYYKENVIFNNEIKKEYGFETFEWNEIYKWNRDLTFKLMLATYKETEFADLFKELIKLLKIDTYVELGVKEGYMFNQISPLVRFAIGVDILPMDKVIKRPNIQTWQMLTEEAAYNWMDPIDFLFIDASHKKEDVLRDFDLFSKFVREGTGIIALHDTHPIHPELFSPIYCDNAWEAAWEIRTNPKYNKDFEIFTIPGPFAGLSLIRKSKKQLSRLYKSNKIYDCFLFNDELDILEIRLNELNDVVDKFVIIEANETHTRQPKELVYKNNEKLFSQFQHKIIYIPIEFPIELKPGWEVENYQRNQIMRGLENCNYNDIIIISDVDEIPKKELFYDEKINTINQQLNSNFLQINQSLRYYYLNYEDTYKWYGSVVVSYSALKQYSPQTFRNIRESNHGIKIENGGWHLSYISDLDGIQKKIKTVCHPEVQGNDITNSKYLTKCINEGLLFFNPTKKFKLVPIEECNLPDYVKQNLDKYERFIKR